jgi:hypothetical protein
VSRALERIRKAARERKKERFTALFHQVSTDLLKEAFFELREDASPVHRALPKNAVLAPDRPSSRRWKCMVRLVVTVVAQSHSSQRGTPE